MLKPLLFSPFAVVAMMWGIPLAAGAADRDAQFFKSVEGQWRGPGEIVAGKYKGTKFICNFKGSTPDDAVGMALDGSCRVGVFTQPMSARIERNGRAYKGQFLDGAQGKGLDVVSGNVDGRRVVFALNRKQLNGAFLANLSGRDSMNVTVSVRVNNELVPVIGMNLTRVGEPDSDTVAQR